MRSRRFTVAAVAAVATALSPAAAQAQENADPNAKAEFLGTIKRSAGKATLRVRYNCASGQALWVSAKQSKSGKKAVRLTREGGSRFAASWYQSHRNAFVCNGAPQTATFTIDKVEPGSKGRLRKGRAWVQFCVTQGEGDQGALILSKAAWVRVR